MSSRLIDFMVMPGKGGEWTEEPVGILADVFQRSKRTDYPRSHELSVARLGVGSILSKIRSLATTT